MEGALSDGGLRIVSAASVSLEEFAAALTAAFSGYHFPLSLDAAGLARKVRFEQIDLQQSLFAREGAEAVGVAALAIRGWAGWVAGFGVVPVRRGQGVGRSLMAALLERARACGLRRLSLEVLAQNAAARRLYEGAGMRVARELLLLERAGVAVADSGAPGSSPLRDAAPAELLPHFARLHRVAPAWQRDLPSLLTGRSRGLYLGEKARPEAYALLSEGPNGNFLSDLAAPDAERASELCAALGSVAVAGTLKVINEPEQSLFAGPLLAHGFVETGRQHEMVMEL
jgi:GNAT superfamily N-acetyltransferase